MRQRRALSANTRADDPPFRLVGERFREVLFLVVDGVMRCADVGACGEVMAVDGDAAGEDFAREETADGWGETHCFVDAGAEVVG